MTLRGLSTLSGVAAAASFAFVAAACGGSQPAAPASSPATSAVVRIVEPAEGSSSGHIDLFRWAPVEGATGYRMHLAATTDGRTVWDSPVTAETEAHLPNTVALEPEGYIWTVTAMKGDAVLATSPTSRFTVTP